MNLSELCQCGHTREEHACPTHRGVCSACYGASDHGQNEYCGRFRGMFVAAGSPRAYKSDAMLSHARATGLVVQELPLPKLTDPSVRCSCGVTYTLLAWQRLPRVVKDGVEMEGFDDGVDLVVMRNCVACGSTISYAFEGLSRQPGGEMVPVPYVQGQRAEVEKP